MAAQNVRNIMTGSQSYVCILLWTDLELPVFADMSRLSLVVMGRISPLGRIDSTSELNG